MLTRYLYSNFLMNGCETGVTSSLEMVCNAYTDMPYSVVKCCISKAPDNHQRLEFGPRKGQSFLSFFMFGHHVSENV